MPKQSSTGGKDRLGGITKAGDRYIRRMLVIGATGLIRYKRKNVPGGLAWLGGLLAKKPVRLVTPRAEEARLDAPLMRGTIDATGFEGHNPQ